MADPHGERNHCSRPREIGEHHSEADTRMLSTSNFGAIQID